MRSLSLSVIILGMFHLPSLCQEVGYEVEANNKKPFFFGVELGYNMGLGNISFAEDVKAKNKGYLVRARLVAGKFINPQLALGGGFGMEGYHDPTYNLFPIFVDLRYVFTPERNSMFVKTNVGYAVGLSSNFNQGFLAGVGLGYRISGKRAATMFSVGLDLHQIHDDHLLVIYPDERPPAYLDAAFFLTSLAIGVGFFF